MSAAGGPIVLCFGVVDEADILRDFIEYHRALGVERFVATDVGSTDGTLDILAAYERRGLLHLERLADPSVRPELRDWTGGMAARAREVFGAEWCLFCDPDEFWVFAEGDARSYFAAAPAPIVVFPRYNLLPAAAPGSGEAVHYRQFDLVVNRPLEFIYDLGRLAEPGGVHWMLGAHPPDILRYIGPKVLARPEVVHLVRQGFHDVQAIDPATPRHRETGGYVGHFQIRDSARYANKARLVADYIDANPPQADRASSRHWVRLAALYRAGLVGAEYARQLLGPADIDTLLQRGVIERDRRIPDRLASLGA